VSPLETSITLEDVFAVVSAKRVPLAPELAGYLALEIAEGVGQAPGEIDPSTVYIGDEGSVALVRPKRSDAPGDAEASVRVILHRLLEASGSQTPSLAHVAKRDAGSGIAAVVSELEAALIPVNRSAGRRALARLAREVKRVTLGVGRNASVPTSERGPRASAPPGPLQSAPSTRPAPDPSIVAAAAAAVAPARFEVGVEEVPTTARREIPAELLENAAAPDPSANELPAVALSRADLAPPRDDVDSLLSSFEVSNERADKAVARDLKAMVGLEPTRTPPPVGRPPADPSEDAGLDSLLAMTGSSPPVASAPSRQASNPAMPGRSASPSYAEDRVLPTAPSKTKPRSTTKKPAKTDRLLLVLLVILLASGAGVLWMLKPGFFTGRTPEKIEQERVARETDKQRAALVAETAKTCKATLVVTDVPDRAEVLLRVGQAPADVEHMPVGARLEFVATAEGHVPRRTVVPANAAWDPGPDGKPRFEVAVQLEPVKPAKPGARAAATVSAEVAWPAGEPGTDVGGQGSPGTVHVVSTPRGAEIWLLAGMGPEALIEQLPCKGDVDVLLAGPGAYRKRIHLKESEFVTSEPAAGPAVRKARVSVR
jgi:hypothetical protein